MVVQKNGQLFGVDKFKWTNSIYHKTVINVQN